MYHAGAPQFVGRIQPPALTRSPDFITTNILIELSDRLNSFAEEQIYAALGEPQREPLLRTPEAPPGPSAPDYIVDVPNFSISGHNLLEKKISVIDFDQSFPVDAPPEEMLGTPSKYLAPEAIFDLKSGAASDVWALGCAIFRMRAGYDLFEVFGTGARSNSIIEMARALGSLPEAWSSIRFDDDGVPIRNKYDDHDDGDNQEGTLLEFLPLEKPLMDRILKIRDPRMDGRPATNRKRALNGNFNGSRQPSPPVDAAPALECENSAWFWTPLPTPSITSVRKDNGEFEDIIDNGYEDQLESETQLISREEALSPHDLLAKIFVYEPSRRLTAEEVLRHEWLSRKWQ